MAKISILIAFLVHLLFAMTQRQPSPCSEYFTYMTISGITDMLGQIEIPSPSENDTFFLKVTLDTTTGWPSQIARLELAQTIQESVRNVHQSKPLLYHVYYGLIEEPIPLVSAIWFNDKQYCPSSKVSGNIAATIELGHILYPPNEEQLVYNDGPWQLNSLPWDRNSSIYRRDQPNYDRLNYESELNNECGITSYYTDDTNRLISDGEKTLPGQWPWLVAIYIQRPDNESAYDFKGAGSLLTTRHVLTEKYCIWNILRYNKDNSFLVTYVDPLRVYVSFGQFKSTQWHGNQTGIINRMIVDYKPFQYANKTSDLKHNGLAILILETAVEYNAFIKPVCLWSGSTNLQDIVNMTGYIVGWGYDVKGTSDNPTYQGYHEEPRMVTVPLINISREPHHEEVFLQHPQEHSRYQRACNPGGGLMVYNITTNRYELRGIALYCGSIEATYIDVAHHLSWIREQISII